MSTLFTILLGENFYDEDFICHSIMPKYGVLT